MTKGPWAVAAEDILQQQEVQVDQGLSKEEVARRLERDGMNRLRPAKRRSALAIFIAQFRNMVMLLLVAAATVSAVFGDIIEAVAVAVLILINVALGFTMELRAGRRMEALLSMSRVDTRVRRDGQSRMVPAEGLVLGDVLVLEGGDMVTADARIIEASMVEVDESTFTGESIPVGKAPGLLEPDTELYSRSNMLYKGTTVNNGHVVAVVVATGSNTELGHIADLVEGSQKEATPLEVRLGALGRQLIVVALALAALITVVGILRGQGVQLMVKTGVALAVAAIPEGLPVVATLALARGMLRMARRNAIVRRLAAVETLGSTSVICVDKTGTLTENHMSVSDIWVDGEAEPEVDLDAEVRKVITAAVLCNNARLDPSVGEPMEVALLESARSLRVDVDEVRSAEPRVNEWAFRPEKRMMATQHGDRIIVKGAPEAVIAACTVRHGEQRIDRIIAESDAMGAKGLRVIAVAEGADPSDPYRELTFLGLIGLSDPPREDVRDAIAACHAAGIQVCMVTGDQRSTAARIAAEVGIPTEPAMLGEELRAVQDDGGGEADRVRSVTVFSRVSPEQKLDIIMVHQAAGHVVAMTGDGVNDAPALRKADIGIAMGGRGTQVAKEAADVVLQDDSFPTIVEAVRLGRAIFTNIRRFTYYLLSCNVAEIAVIAVAMLIGGGLPLLPLQILYLNLVTDVFPALALGFGRGDPQAMKQPPRPRAEGVLARRHAIGIIGYGAMFTVAVLAAFFIARGPLGLDATGAVTVSFSTLALAQLWHVFNMRDPGSGLFQNDVVRNGYVWGALVLSASLVLAAVHIPPMASVLTLRPLDLRSWGLVVVASLVPLLIGQTGRVLAGLRWHRRV